MDEALKQLYETTVPQDVRVYLDAKTAPAKPKRPPRPSPPKPPAASAAQEKGDEEHHGQ